MRRIQHTLTCILALLIAGFVINSWSNPALASLAHQAEKPITLHIAMPEPDTLDPVKISRFDLHARDLVENLFAGLTRFDPATQQVEPMLATEWSVSENGLTWTFELRSDIQWVRLDTASQDIAAVRPVTAGDFVYTLQRACDPRRPSPVTTNVMIIQGCLTIANTFPEIINDVFIAREMGVRATGPNTLEIDLMFPAEYFPTLLSTPEFRPLARESIIANDTWATAQPFITNGAYVMSAWDTNGLTLIRNPLWPNTYTGNIEQVQVMFTDEMATATALTTGGGSDMARLAPEEIAAIRQTYPDLLQISAGTTLTMLGFSYDRAIVATPEGRRALSFAIDREALVAQFFPDQARTVNQFVSSGVVAAPDVDNTLFDPVLAQTQLATAGFPKCDGIPELLIILVPDNNPIWVELGQTIRQQWSTVLGCNQTLFEIKPISRPLLIELAHATYDTEKVTRSHLWLTTWSADYPDANAWIHDALHCNYGYIRTGRECDDGDTLLNQATLETDLVMRADLYAQAENYFFGPAGTFPVIPLFISSSAWLQHPWLTDVNATGPARFDLWNIDIERQIITTVP